MGVLQWLSEKFTEQTGIEVPEGITEGVDDMTDLDERADEGFGEVSDY